MRINLPHYALKIINELREGGYEAWAVGGAVRDVLLGRIPDDWDITTSAIPDEVCACLESAGIRVICASGLRHGTVTAVCDGFSCEVTTYRAESCYSDNRHPDGVSFISDLSADLSRRDFTVNAIAADTHCIVDPFSGRIDLENHVIRAVGEPILRFREDALRILRGLRFAAQLGFSIESTTLTAMRELSSLVPSVSAERTLVELDKLLAGKYSTDVIREYGDILCRSLGIDAQYDLFLAAAEHKELPRDRDVLFVLFFGNESVVAANAFKLSNKRKKSIMSMIEMKDSSLPLSRTEMLRALRRYGENIDRCIELCSFDPLLMKNAKMARYLLEDIRSENACYNISSLAVNGKDAINLGFSGIQIGCALELVLEAVITDKLPNRKDALISFLEKMRGDGDVFI